MADTVPAEAIDPPLDVSVWDLLGRRTTTIKALKLLDKGIKIWKKLAGDKSWAKVGPKWPREAHRST